MIKKEITDMSKRDQLLSRAKDKVHTFLLAEGQIRGAILHGTHMIKETKLNHHLGVLETLVLGHAYLGIGLMASNLKSEDRVSFKIECEGPIKGLSVEATAHGEVRGYLKQNPIPIDKPLESFDLSPFFGTGYLEVINWPEAAKHPYTGRVTLKYGKIASDLANYYSQSNQTPTSFNLSIKFDQEGYVTGAGGLLLQMLPDAEPGLANQLESLVLDFPSLGDAFTINQPAEELIKTHFKDLSPNILDNRRVEFFCPCQKERLAGIIAQLPQETLKDMLDNGPMPVETLCHNCNTTYQFSREDVEGFYDKKK